MKNYPNAWGHRQIQLPEALQWHTQRNKEIHIKKRKETSLAKLSSSGNLRKNMNMNREYEEK